MKRYQITLKHGHPTRSYQRGGYTFEGHLRTVYEPTPVIIPASELSDELKNDGWLEIVELPDEAA